jgi:iron complex transport system permease protein
LVLADMVARLALAPTELPVGIVTALIGVPFFISLLRRRHHYGMQ